MEIGIDEALDNGIVLVEWPNIIKNFFPKNRLEIYLEFLNNKAEGRKITLKGYGMWKEKLFKYNG